MKINVYPLIFISAPSSAANILCVATNSTSKTFALTSHTWCWPRVREHVPQWWLRVRHPKHFITAWHCRSNMREHDWSVAISWLIASLLWRTARMNALVGARSPLRAVCSPSSYRVETKSRSSSFTKNRQQLVCANLVTLREIWFLLKVFNVQVLKQRWSRVKIAHAQILAVQLQNKCSLRAHHHHLNEFWTDSHPCLILTVVGCLF